MTDTNTADRPEALRLVEILAKNWRVWPAGNAVQQTSLGDVFCSTKGRSLMFGSHEIAADQETSVVTKQMWAAQLLAAREDESLQIDPVENATGETMCKVRFFIETPAGWVGAYHKAPLEYLLAARDNTTAPKEPLRNTGHGHVFPRADGVKARCGGPGVCVYCSIDAARAKEGKA